MGDHQMTYNMLQSRAARQGFPDAITEGLLWPLVFFWVVGIGVFIFALPDLLLGVVWTIVVLLIAYGMVRSNMGKRETRQRLIAAALKKQCLGQGSWDPTVWESGPIQRGKGILVTAALDLHDLEETRGPDDDLRCSYTGALDLLWLQYSLLTNAQDLERNLRLADSTYPSDAELPGVDSEVTASLGTHQRNLEAVEELATQAHSRAVEVSQQLDAFLPALQSLKSQSAHSYQVAVAELAQETATVLELLQARSGV